MGYKIPNIPSSKAYVEELADFWEVQALKTSQPIAQINVMKTLDMGSDELDIEGVESAEDQTNSLLDEVLQEINERALIFPNYPFKIGSYSIEFEPEKTGSCVYVFLLLATRLNMTKHKVQEDIDGTQVFEQLCALVAKNYFGTSSDSFVFGTAEQGGFEEKINNLIKKVGIGTSFKNPNDNVPTAKDDAVDIIVWKEFRDGKEGKMIGFGQCKTGTSWRDNVHQLNPSGFCDNWLLESPVLSPIPMVFISDTLNKKRNFISGQRHKLYFNRFRIMEYLPDDLPQDLQKNLTLWIEGASKKIELDE